MQAQQFATCLRKELSAPGTITGVDIESSPKVVSCHAGYKDGQHQRAMTTIRPGSC
jgi:hypothetical protein